MHAEVCGEAVTEVNRAVGGIAPSLRASLLTAVIFGLALALLVYGLWLPEPWDVVGFTLLSLGIPLAGLAATLTFVARELPRPWGLAPGAPARPWQAVFAIVVAVTLFLSGWVLFLRPYQH